MRFGLQNTELSKKINDRLSKQPDLPELQINEKPAFFNLKMEHKMMIEELSEDFQPRSRSTSAGSFISADNKVTRGEGLLKRN